MWALTNLTPYAAERNWTRDKHGRHFWLVAVRATFDVSEAGRIKLADAQPPPALAPEYTGEPGTSSLLLDSDLLHAKSCTDVIADAVAYAPGGRPTESIVTSLRVGPIDKQLRIYGERAYYEGPLGIATTAPVPFVQRAIRYESAYGGADFSDSNVNNHKLDEKNPVGRGVASAAFHLVGQAAHTIEYADGHLTKASPAGFGPIDPAWAPRRLRAGTYDASWVRNRRPLLPADYDELYASSAPEDQRAERPLRGGEPVDLRGLTPTGVLRFELPKIYLTYSTRFGTRREEHRGHLSTVLLLSEAMQVVLIWQTRLFVAPRDSDYLDETVIGEKPYLL